MRSLTDHPLFGLPAVLSLMLTCPAAWAGGDDALQKCRGTYGERPAAWHQSGTVESPRHGQGTFERWFEPPDRLKVVVEFPDGWSEERILLGDVGWRGGIEVQGPALAGMVLQAARLEAPWLLARTDEVADLGPGEKKGTHRFRVAIKGGTLDVVIEVESGLVLSTTGKAGPIVIETDYGDHQRKDGVMLAGSEVTRVMGAETGRRIVKEIEVLESIPAEEFRPKDEHGPRT